MPDEALTVTCRSNGSQICWPSDRIASHVPPKDTRFLFGVQRNNIDIIRKKALCVKEITIM